MIFRITSMWALILASAIAPAKTISFEGEAWKEVFETTGIGAVTAGGPDGTGSGVVLDTRGATGDWNVVIRSKAGVFAPGRRYTIRVTARILDLGPSPSTFYFMTRPLGTNLNTPLRTSTEVGSDRVFEHWFVNGAFADTSLQIGLRKTGRVWVRRIEIVEEARLKPEVWSAPGVPAKTKEAYEPVGLCVHADRVTDTPFGYSEALLARAFEMWKATGVQWIRLSPGNLFPTKEAALRGEADPVLRDRMTRLMKGLRDRGIKFYLILRAGQVPWFKPTPEQVPAGFPAWSVPSPDPDDYRVFIEAMAKLYGRETTVFEIGNEMDWEFWSGTPEQFVTNLATARKALQAQNPAVRIMSGGLAGDGILGEKPGKADFLARMYQSGLKDQTDLLAFHLYQKTVEENLYQLNRSLAVMKRFGDGSKPIWITETAKCALVPTADWNWVPSAEAERLQSDYLQETFTRLLRHPNIEKIFWWNFKALKAKPDGETGLALVGTNLEPRMAYETLKQLPKPTVRMVNPDFLKVDGLDRP